MANVGDAQYRVMSRLETVGGSIDVFGLDGVNGIHDLLLEFRWPLDDLGPKFFKFFLHALVCLPAEVHRCIEPLVQYADDRHCTG